MTSETAPRSGEVEHKTSVRWTVLSLLVLASFIGYVLRTNMSVAGERMMADLGLSREQLGMILAAFAWGYAIFQFPGGVLGDVIGLRRAMALIVVLWGAVNLLTGFVPGESLSSPTVIIVSLITIRFLMGVVQAPLYPLTGATICNWFPEAGWALPNGLTNTGLTLGSAATGPLIAWLALTVGWRLSFIVTAPLAFVVAFIWWRYVRDTPAEHPGANAAECAFIDRNRQPAAALAADKTAWKAALVDRDVLLLTVSYVFSNFVFYFFFNWLFIYLVEDRGLETLESGFYSAAPWITGAIGASLGGWVCDRLSERIGMRWGCALPSIASLVLSGLFLGAAATAGTPVLAVVFLSLCLGCQQFAEGPYWAATISVGGRRCAAACGVLNTGGNVVGGVVALVVPVIVSAAGWIPALVTASGFAFVAAGLWLFIRADRPPS